MKPKEILLTGATGMIGQAISKHLVNAGFKVSTAGRQGATYAMDLGDLPSVKKAVQAFFRNAQNPYGLICNAGHLGPVGLFWKTPMDTWQKSVSDNFLAHAAMIHAFAEEMDNRKHHEGAIAVLSGAGVGNAGDFAKVTSYSTSKAALVHLTEALSQELDALGITINAIAPGPVQSGMIQQATRGGKEAPSYFVSPDLAAELATYLMSPEARKISGRLISARFDRKTLSEKARAIHDDVHWFRLRRIDYEKFSPQS